MYTVQCTGLNTYLCKMIVNAAKPYAAPDLNWTYRI